MTAMTLSFLLSPGPGKMFCPQQVLNEFYLIQGQQWEGEQVHLQTQARPLVRGQPIRTTQQEVLTSRRCDLESDTTWGLELTLKGIRTWMCILTRLWEGLGRPPGSRPEATLAPGRGQVCGHSHACQFCQEVVWLGLRETVITSLMKEEQKEEQRMRRAFEKSWYVHSAAPACFWNPSIPMTRPVCDLWWGKNWEGMGPDPWVGRWRARGGEVRRKVANQFKETGREERRVTGFLGA